MQNVKFMLILAPGVIDLKTAKTYRPCGNKTLWAILTEVHQRTPPKRWTTESRRYAVFNVYPHCFGSIQMNGLTEDLSKDLANRVLAAMLDCGVLNSRNLLVINRVLERYYDGSVDKNLYIVGANRTCAGDFDSALVPENDDLLTGMLIIELLENRLEPTVKKVLVEMAK